jgi:hypothetical protein
MLLQEHTGGGVEDEDEHVVCVTETVVTDVTVTVEGGIVGHVVGAVVPKELAMQLQALVNFAADEEQALAKAG